MFRNNTDIKCVLDEKVNVEGYYDVVNFACQVKVSGFYTFGYNDLVCAPSTVFSSINSIIVLKTLLVVPETEQSNKATEWKFNILQKGDGKY